MLDNLITRLRTRIHHGASCAVSQVRDGWVGRRLVLGRREADPRFAPGGLRVGPACLELPFLMQ